MANTEYEKLLEQMNKLIEQVNMYDEDIQLVYDEETGNYIIKDVDGVEQLDRVSLSAKLRNTVNQIKNLHGKIEHVSVYDIDAYSIIQLYYKLAQKVNELIDEFIRIETEINDNLIAFNESIQYMLTQGLEEDVSKKIDEMYNNGVLAEIINEQIFEELNTKVDELTEQVDDLLVNQIGYLTIDHYGAVGDGVTDDYQAVKDCITQANELGIPVKTQGKKYLLSAIAEPIEVQTSIDLNGGTIIIDEDNSLSNDGVLKIVSKHEPIEITSYSALTINKQTRSIPLLGGNGMCLVDVINENKKQYIRTGANASSGYNQTDQFLIDDEGNVLNEIQWDFENITGVTLYPVDSDVLEIKNGIIKTIECKTASANSYVDKNIIIERSNVVIKNMGREIEENGSECRPSHGIYYVRRASNVKFQDVLIKSRRESYDDGGTYDLQLYKAVDIVLDGVVDLGLNEVGRWGVFTMNYGKDIKVINSKLSRLDAHRGVWNLTVENCSLGKGGLNLIGGGYLIVNNLITRSAYLVNFRNDYGATWNGRIRIKNVQHFARPQSTIDSDSEDTKMVKLLYFNNTMQNDYGYECVMTRGIQIENYYLHNTESQSIVDVIKVSPNLYEGDIVADYKMRFPYEISLKNIKADNGGFRVIKTPLSCFKIGYPYEYEEIGEQYSSTAKGLRIKPNCTITIDDVTLATPNAVGDSNTIYPLNTGRVATDEYTSTSTNPVPKIIIRNCNNVYNNLQALPCVWEVSNCEVITFNCVSSGSRSYGVFSNCQFNPAMNDTSSLGIRVNTNLTTFINCIFNKQTYVTAPDDLFYNMANVYNFLGYHSVTEESGKIRHYCNMIGCIVHSDIDPSTLYPNVLLYGWKLNDSHGNLFIVE